jgi:hypothetical protein
MKLIHFTPITIWSGISFIILEVYSKFHKGYKHYLLCIQLFIVLVHAIIIKGVSTIIMLPLKYLTHDCSQSFSCNPQRHNHVSFYHDNIASLIIYSLIHLYYIFLRKHNTSSSSYSSKQIVTTLQNRVSHASMVFIQYWHVKLLPYISLIQKYISYL